MTTETEGQSLLVLTFSHATAGPPDAGAKVSVIAP
jgi:hypothetical protein